MPAPVDPPPAAELDAALGPCRPLWDEALTRLERGFGPLAQVWMPSGNPFGRHCRLQRKGRTLVYLLPGAGGFLAGVVLGERATQLALEGGVPEAHKQLLREARPYVEGRGIRFPVASPADLAALEALLACKAARR